MKEVILTPEGFKKLQREIDLLRGEKRREVAERIRVAREFGDIAENAEYDDAKNEQAMLEHKIAQLEERLLSARVITKREISKDTVSIGSHVRIKDMEARQDVRVPHRRLGRGEPGREQALERVAGRQGDHGQEEGRDRRGHGAARRAEVQDHGDQSRLTPGGAGRAGRSPPAAPSPRRPPARAPGDRQGRLQLVAPMEIVRLERSRRQAPCSRGRSSTTRRGCGCCPTRERRARLLPWLFRIGFDITAADVYATAGAVLGAARWLPPGRAPMRVGATLRALVDDAAPARLCDAAVPRLRPCGRGAARGGDRRPALVPRRDRRRAGRAAAGHRRRAARARASPPPSATVLPAVLLTNNEDNLSVLRGHGFARGARRGHAEGRPARLGYGQAAVTEPSRSATRTATRSRPFAPRPTRSRTGRRRRRRAASPGA